MDLSRRSFLRRIGGAAAAYPFLGGMLPEARSVSEGVDFLLAERDDDNWNNDVEDSAYATLALYYTGHNVANETAWLKDEAVKGNQDAGWSLQIRSAFNGSCDLEYGDKEKTITLTDNVNMLYKMDSLYSSEHDRILNFNDPALSIDLGVAIDSIVIADKDKNAPYLNDIDNNFYL